MTQAVRAMQAGGPEVLEFSEIETPQPGPGEVLIDVEAAGVNFIDTYRRSGVYPMEYPHVVGVEGTGRIAEVGEGVESWSLGDRVAWHDAHGSYSTQVVADADMILSVPEFVRTEVAAAMPLQGLTAQYLATSSHEIKPGQTALVHAGAGGVGLLLTQIIKHLGGKVITTVSTEEKAELSRKAGADEAFLYGEGVDITAKVKELTNGEGVEVVYDGVGKDTFDASLASLKPLGSMVLFGGSSGQVPPFDIQRLNSSGGIFLSRPSLQWFVRTPEQLAKRASMLFNGLEHGWLDFRVGATFPLPEAAEAHRALEGRKTTGKVVLTV
ncbi:NADPH2:quinone reductase [Brevibacterium sanguinis]|uniref:NADPH2:quinone reductase n=2 Tax=Brevibacterium TaxID=1696 RepID=A0A366INZ7_9MICO|nr:MULTISPECIES: quinone oxidoreductase [Brevibacterium]RBP67790.1 NADPH2:quinone reductase [Brevibacterium sanguinis]RBP74793.1 NADPH2:quinone reductase [Brevibacterium celere]